MESPNDLLMMARSGVHHLRLTRNYCSNFRHPLVLAVLKKPFGHGGAKKQKLVLLAGNFYPVKLVTSECKIKMFRGKSFH